MTTESKSPIQGKAGTAAIALLALFLAAGITYAIKQALNPGTATAKGADIKPDSVEAVLNAAASYIKEDQPGKAEAILKEAITKYVDDQRLYIQYGELLVGAKRPEEAYEMYIKALAIGPRTPDLEFTSGTVANMAGKLDRAIEHYSMAQSQKKNDPKISLYLAQVQVKLDDLVEAKKNLLISGNLDPDQATVWGTLGEIAIKENKPDIALNHAKRARELEPANINWRLVECRARKRLNKPEEALQLMVGLSDAEKMQPGVLPLMAECFGMLHRPGDAGEAYARASDVDSGNIEFATQAAAWLEKADRKDAAKRYADRAKRLADAAESDK